MAYKESKKSYENYPEWKYKDLPVNSEFEGKLIEKRVIHTRDMSNNPRDIGLYVFETNEGKKQVWGCASLDDKMKNVPVNSQVKIVYLGKEKTKKGIMFHSVQVFYDDGSTEENPFDTI